MSPKQLNATNHRAVSDSEAPQSARRHRTNKKWPPIYFLEVPQPMPPSDGLESPAKHVSALGVAKEMMLAAAKSRKCAAFWSKRRGVWLLVSLEPFDLSLPPFCGAFASLRKLRNRQSDYAKLADYLRGEIPSASR